MAQYRKNFYGSALYGKTTAFTSEYLSAMFDAGEPFDGPIQVSVTASTPVARYLPGDKEVQGGGVGMTVGQKATFMASVRDTTIGFAGKASGAFNLSTYVIGATGDWELESQQSVSMVGVSTMTRKTAVSTYEERKVEVEVTSGMMDLLWFDAEVTDYSIEVGTSATRDGVFLWELLPLSGTGTKQVTSAEKTGVRYVRFRITLASSDDEAVPTVDKVELLNGQAGTRSPSGSWQGRFNMEGLAQAVGKTFVRMLQVDWTETRPNGTNLSIRSRGASVVGSTNYGPETAEYRKGYRRIRLPRTATEGFVYTKTPVDVKTMLGQKNTNRQWRDIWDVKSLPTSTIGQRIRYEFYDQAPTGTARPIAVVEGNTLSRAKMPAVLNTPDGGKNFYVGIRLLKRLTEATPVVDWLAFSADIDYREPRAFQGDVSAVDNGDGRKMLRTMNVNDFGWPTNTNGNSNNATQLQNERSLRLIDRTGNSGVRLFFLKGENDGSGLKTTDLSEQVWAHAKGVEPEARVGEVDAGPLFLHFHYNGGSVQYPHTDQNELGSDFTPSLSSSRKYRYSIQNGWPDREQRLDTAMTWAEAAEMLGTDEATLRATNPGKLEYEGRLLVGQWLKEPNESLNERAEVAFQEGLYTETSTHNRSGNAVIEARMVSAEYGVTPWTSEEKVYQGYINLNDVRGRYRRTQRDVFLQREEVSHIVRTGETYPSIALEYGVDTEDLARLNDNRLLVVGESIRVPSRLALPRLAPEVLFLDDDGQWVDNPYKVEIVPNSVRRKDGTRLADTTVFLETDGIEVSRSEAPATSIVLTRGPEANGKEPLGHSHVIDILSVVDQDGISYSKEAGNLGDYRLEGNYISWAKAGQTTKEPAAGKTYTVSYKYEQVDELTASFDSEHRQRAGFDVLWRSEEMLTLDGIVSPENDLVMALPEPAAFRDWNEGIRATDYIVEDNDLWVKTSIEEREGRKVLVASMEGRDPRRNWHPEMNTGFYYLGKEEFYLYSEPIEETYGRESIPTAKAVRYAEGAIVLSEAAENLLGDGLLESTERKRKVFVPTEGEPFTHL